MFAACIGALSMAGSCAHDGDVSRAAAPVATTQPGAEPASPAEAPTRTETPLARHAEPDGQGDWPRELFPNVTVHAPERWVEFAGIVPISTSPDVPGAPDPDVLLELVATTPPGGRDHESLVLTEAKPSHVHAALLVLNLQPGSPGEWRTIVAPDGTPRVEGSAPTGPRLEPQLRWTDPASGELHTAHPSEWIRHIDTGERPPSDPLVFAGSRFVLRQNERRYDADFTGTLVGLAQFGAETVAWPTPYHHDEATQAPVWFADNGAVPPFGTPVALRLTVHDQPVPPPQAR